MVRPTIGKMCGIGKDQYRIRDMNRRLTGVAPWTSI
jgi:hypothetical protein